MLSRRSLVFALNVLFAGVPDVLAILILIVNAAVYLSGELFQSSTLRMLGWSLLLVQGVLISAELRRVGGDLQRLLEGRCRVFRNPGRFGIISNYGATLSEIARRVDWIEDAADEQVCSLRGDPGRDVERYGRLSTICEDLMMDLKDLRGPVEYVVIWSDEDGGHYLSSRSEQSRIGMVRNLLEAHLRLLSSEPGFKGEGLLRIDRSDFLGRLLSLQGFDSACWWKLGSEECPGVYLWCGFAEYGGLTPLGKQIAGQAIVRFRHNLTALKRFSVLTDRVDQASSMSQQKDVFLSHFSHDVRTPLNNIIHAVRMLRSGKGVGMGLEQLLDIILTSCNRINQQIEEALDYSRSEAGALASNSEIIGLGTVVADMENSWKHAFAEKGLSFEVVADEELSVKCDKRHLSRIIDNLVSNALKYTDIGGVTIDAYQSRRGQVVRIDVSDTGIGFTPEQRAKVFTPFERFGKEGVEGVGLGLSVTRTLVEQNGGVILLESEAGRGTIVSVELPRYVPAEDSKGGTNGLDSGTSLYGMVVEDDDDFRSMMSTVLTRSGAVVVEASSVIEAREKARGRVPGFVIADYSLPGGFVQLEAMIRSFGSDVRVAIMSGYCLTGKVNSAYKVFRKPFEIDEVIKWLKHS